VVAETLGERRSADDAALRDVVAAARQAFARYGVHRTRMEDIAAGAGIPRQYLYRYVSSKQELVELAVLERCREFSDRILALVEDDHDEIGESLVKAIVLCVTAGREDAEFAYLAESLPRSRLNLILSGRGSPMHGYVKRCLAPILNRARANGRLRTDVSDDAIVEWLQGQMTWLTPREDLDEAAMSTMLRDFALPSLLRA
jgi:AcrR family transcriptional regulator